MKRSRNSGGKPLGGKLVELRYLAGLSVEEAAAALGISAQPLTAIGLLLALGYTIKSAVPTHPLKNSQETSLGVRVETAEFRTVSGRAPRESDRHVIPISNKFALSFSRLSNDPRRVGIVSRSGLRRRQRLARAFGGFQTRRTRRATWRRTCRRSRPVTIAKRFRPATHFVAGCLAKPCRRCCPEPDFGGSSSLSAV